MPLSLLANTDSAFVVLLAPFLFIPPILWKVTAAVIN